MTTAYRYEARLKTDDPGQWFAVERGYLEKLLAATAMTPYEVGFCIEDMHKGGEADDEDNVYRAVKLGDPAEGFRVAYTTAPADYDGFGTVTLVPDAGRDLTNGQTLRKVGIRPDAWAWQTSQYASGLHGCIVEETARKFPKLYSIS